MLKNENRKGGDVNENLRSFGKELIYHERKEPHRPVLPAEHRQCTGLFYYETEREITYQIPNYPDRQQDESAADSLRRISEEI